MNLPTQGPHHRPVGLRVLAQILDWHYGVSWSLDWIDWKWYMDIQTIFQTQIMSNSNRNQAPTTAQNNQRS